MRRPSLRSRVLAALAGADRPLSVSEIAAALYVGRDAPARAEGIVRATISVIRRDRACEPTIERVHGYRLVERGAGR